MKTRVVLADDHLLILAALRALLDRQPDIEVVGEAANGAELLEVAAAQVPDVVVMDIAMPVMNGVDVARRLAVAHPGVRILVLSAHADKRYVLGMLGAGAKGYLVKAAAGDELPRAIRAVAAGDMYLSREVSDAVTEGLRQSVGPARKSGRILGPRELQVLTLLAGGKTSRAIAADLHISPATVEVHRRNIMRKLDLHSVAELTRYAIREGLAEP